MKNKLIGNIDMKNIKQPFFSEWPPTAPDPDPDIT